uniref:Uncharacterized protein n=1 Tax=Arundo donax TaxID=35708 RepID=A0A0A9CFT6_ARUDO
MISGPRESSAGKASVSSLPSSTARFLRTSVGCASETCVFSLPGQMPQLSLKRGLHRRSLYLLPLRLLDARNS